MGQYLAIGVYLGLGLTVFISGLIWVRFSGNIRRAIRKTAPTRTTSHDHDRSHVPII
jgi:hypothetical protein